MRYYLSIISACYDLNVKYGKLSFGVINGGIGEKDFPEKQGKTESFHLKGGNCMNRKFEVIDAFELVSESSAVTLSTGEVSEEKKPVDLLLVESLNLFGEVNIQYISRMSGLSVKLVVRQLKDAIFQLPEALTDCDGYDPYKGWVVSSRYLSGNLAYKLKLAKKMNKRFPGMFKRNITALQKELPLEADMDDIHLNLGAPWIPEFEYEDFLKDFLGLSEAPKVQYLKELGRYKITPTEEAVKSVLNTITYGVRADRGNRASGQYLTALKIVENALNAMTIKVCDYVEKSLGGWNNYTREAVVNREKTIEAQEKFKALSKGFREWVYASGERRKRFEEYYNNSFSGYSTKAYNGDFLTFPDLNPDVTFYKHQRDAIARVLLSGTNTLLAHHVGTGKTYEMVASVHELYRMGLSKKNLVVVPNNVLKATVDAHKHLYKDDRILAVYPKDFTPLYRNSVLEKIRDEDYVAVYMAYSSFNMIVMSKQYYAGRMATKIAQLRHAAAVTNDKYEKVTLESEADKLTKKLYKYNEETEPCPWLCFEELGIETIVVDEAHNFKNISIETRADNIVGMSKTGSRKCREMFHKVRNVNRVIFATGTPLTNSLSDLFVLQSYLQPETLEFHGISRFDSWINTFGQQDTFVECDVDANSKNMRTMTRFSSFHNLGELMALFSQVCDFHKGDENTDALPRFNGSIDICVPRNDAQAEYIQGLSERVEKVRSRKVTRKEDNLLKITTDGRKAALDIRLADITAFWDPYAPSKVDTCAVKVYEIYRDFPNTAQVVFSDLGTPKAGFNIYDALKERLLELGVNEGEIAFVHDAASESARARLFRAVNDGSVRVVIGSTQKLGVGVNIQERLKAIHHLSVPWKPSDMVQREGRILRQGNTCDEVFVFRYITEGTFDAYSYQILESKQRFISDFMSGTSSLREIDDIADTVLEYAEVKALAIGNPLIKKRVEVANLLERAKSASRARQKEMQELKAIAEASPKEKARCEKRAKIADADFAFYKEGRETISKEERIAFGEELLDALRGNMAKHEERLFGGYQGFDIMLPADMYEERPYVNVKGRNGVFYPCRLDLDRTPLGCTRALDYLLDHLDERACKMREMAQSAHKKTRSALAELEKGNAYLAEIARLREELEAIDLELEENAKESKAA